MKKLFLAFMAVATIAMVGCKKEGGNDPVGPVTPGGGGGDEPAQTEEAPEVAAPAAGSVTFVIQIPEGSECNGIAFKGTLDGAAWTGADQYLGESGPAAADKCIKFAKVEGKKTWYQATFKVGATPWGDEGKIYMAGKICLIYKNDGSWEGQADGWEFVEEYSTAAHSTSNDGNIQVEATTGLIYVTVPRFQMSECAAAQKYTVTFKTPAWCEGKEVNLEVAGSMNSWGDGTILCEKVSAQEYKASFSTSAGAKFKIRGVGSWDVEIQGYDAEKDEWGGCADNVLGNDANVVVDYSDPEKFRWNVCAE